mgnify:CR=1 FL=1
MISKDYSISFVRCIAMIFIVLCHVQQHYDIKLCWWFNVGVQIFFFISGWLYINKKFDSIKEILEFYFKNAVKILTNYYIYITVVFIVLTYLNKVPEDYINLYKITGVVPGLGHLWFIKYILICYLITPIFVKIIEYFKKKNIIFILAIIVPIIVSILFKQLHMIGAMINCFYFGMLLNSIKDDKHYYLIIKICFLLAFVLNSIQLYVQYVLKLDIHTVKNLHYLQEYAHAFLGIVCFYIFKFIYSKINISEKIKKILNYSDTYSYDVYLTHHIYILGPLSLFNGLEFSSLLLCKILFIILISAFVLNKISCFVKKIIFKSYCFKA